MTMKRIMPLAALLVVALGICWAEKRLPALRAAEAEEPPPFEEDCKNSEDGDLDGDIDCADSDCSSAPGSRGRGLRA